MSNFTTIAPKYRQTAGVQQTASGQLFAMLDIGRSEDVLDLACGTGHLTRKIRSLTDGVVVGTDPSEGMIAEAQHNNEAGSIFRVESAEALNAIGTFDVILCNSALQWFQNPGRAVANCFNALRPGGRMAMQAPARTDYCPNFLNAVASLNQHPDTRATFAHFRSPWFFLETAEEYADLFTMAGFSVLSSKIETARLRCTPAKAFEVFDSGAAAGYLNSDCYDVELSRGYIAAARNLIVNQLVSQAGSDGKLELTFFRIYLLARKP